MVSRMRLNVHVCVYRCIKISKEQQSINEKKHPRQQGFDASE